MPLPSRVVLALPIADESRLAGFVEDCLAAGVELIAVAGPGARQVEDRLDALILGDHTDPDRFIVTSVHEAGLENALFFAENWETAHPATPKVVRL